MKMDLQILRQDMEQEEMVECKAGPWCWDCQNSTRIINKNMYQTITKYFPKNAYFAYFNNDSGYFDECIVCKLYSNSVCKNFSPKEN